MRKAASGDPRPVLTVPEVRELLRLQSDEGAKSWLKRFAPEAILPGGRFRVSRAVLMAIVDRGMEHSDQPTGGEREQRSPGEGR